MPTPTDWNENMLAMKCKVWGHDVKIIDWDNDGGVDAYCERCDAWIDPDLIIDAQP